MAGFTVGLVLLSLDDTSYEGSGMVETIIKAPSIAIRMADFNGIPVATTPPSSTELDFRAYLLGGLQYSAVCSEHKAALRRHILHP